MRVYIERERVELSFFSFSFCKSSFRFLRFLVELVSEGGESRCVIVSFVYFACVCLRAENSVSYGDSYFVYCA